jgi:hypothetical protein
LLLGVLDESDGVGVLILSGLDVELERLRALVLAKVSVGGQPRIVSTDDWKRTPTASLEPPSRGSERGFALLSDDARHVLVLAGEEARRLSHNFIGTEHLLLVMPQSSKVLELSLREARQLDDHDIGPEHILLGLVREGEGLASEVLVSLGAGLATLRQEVLLIISGDATEE